MAIAAANEALLIDDETNPEVSRAENQNLEDSPRYYLSLWEQTFPSCYLVCRQYTLLSNWYLVGFCHFLESFNY